MFVSTLAFAGLSFTKPRSHRIFHNITAAITLVASIAYFTMGSDLGQTPITVQFLRHNSKVHGVNREIFYVRYIDWWVGPLQWHLAWEANRSRFITTPLLLLDLLLTAGLPWPTILFTILLDEVMIVTGLIGALVQSSYKVRISKKPLTPPKIPVASILTVYCQWGYFTFGFLAFLWVAWTVVWTARKHTVVLGPEISRTYNIVGVWTISLWFLYPIAWGLSEGGNVIAPDSEAVFYGILDILAKPVFGALLIWGHRNIDPVTLGRKSFWLSLRICGSHWWNLIRFGNIKFTSEIMPMPRQSVTIMVRKHTMVLEPSPSQEQQRLAPVPIPLWLFKYVWKRADYVMTQPLVPVFW